MPRKRKQQRRAYGSGSIKWREDGKADLFWYENGKKKKKKGRPAHLAEKLLADITKRVRDGLPGVVGFQREYKTIDDYAQHWFSIRLTVANKNDWDRYNLHLRPILGHLPASAIAPSFVRDEIVKKKRRTHGGATVKNMVRILSSMWSDMAEDGLVEYNPFKTLSKKTRGLLQSDYDPKRGPWLQDTALVLQLFSALRKPVNYFFAVGVWTGMRPGEIRGLDWVNVEWDRKRINVVQQVNEDLHCITRCKDRDSRIVPLLPELEPLLREWWEENGCPKEGLVFLPVARPSSLAAAEKREWIEDYYRAHLPGKLPTIKNANAALKARFDGYMDYADHMAIRVAVQGKQPRQHVTLEVVQGPEPAPKNRRGRVAPLFIGISLIRQEWHKARKDLGIKYMRLYDASRHSFATQWLVAGGTRDELKDLLGHSDLSTTERYVHMAKDFSGSVGRSLFGVDTAAAVRKAIQERQVGLMWKLQGLPEPPPPTDEELDEEEAV